MYKKFVYATYTLNIVFQALFTLLTPVAFLFFGALLAVKKLSAPEWLYAPCIAVGFVVGFVSMIRFVISALVNLERLRKSHNDSKKQ